MMRYDSTWIDVTWYRQHDVIWFYCKLFVFFLILVTGHQKLQRLNCSSVWMETVPSYLLLGVDVVLFVSLSSHKTAQLSFNLRPLGLSHKTFSNGKYRLSHLPCHNCCRMVKFCFCCRKIITKILFFCLIRYEGDWATAYHYASVLLKESRWSRVRTEGI